MFARVHPERLSPQALPDKFPGRHDLDALVAGGPEQRPVTADDAVRPTRQRTFEKLYVVPVRAGIVRWLHGHDEERVQCDAIEHRTEFYAGELRADSGRYFAIFLEDLR